ncbi:MAG: DUF1330 domain-containing protein [Sneathiella sp.]
MVNNNQNDARVDRLIAWYGNGEDGTCPTRTQWLHLLRRSDDAPITFVNFFKMRDEAIYPEGQGVSISGEAAFQRYATVSVPTVEKVGGRFLLLAPFEASFLGADENWDLVAVGAYPNAAAALNLYENEDYRAAFMHRRAACADQKVLVCAT